MRHSGPVTSSEPGPSGRDLVTAYLADQSAEIERAGRSVVAGDPEGVHDLRVACRRARSALRSHRRLLRPLARPGAADLVGDLRQLGLDLSGPRDDEVVRELVNDWAHQDGWPDDTLRALLGGLDPASVPGAAASTVAVRATSLGTAVDA